MITSARKVQIGSYCCDKRPDGTVQLTSTYGEVECEITLAPSDVAAMAKDLVDVIEVKGAH